MKIFEQLDIREMDLFTQTIKTKFGKEIQFSFDSYQPDENDEFFFWVDVPSLCEYHILPVDQAHEHYDDNEKVHEKFGVIRIVLKDDETICYKSILKLTNGKYKASIETPCAYSKDYIRLEDALEVFCD